ncbi:MAG: hypothetical protein PHG36_07930, partial [Dehalococcoidia bacterium]|nr:hypothetical protein [Dehalococcoidia bacterium]
DLAKDFQSLAARLMVAAINDGRLPVITETKLILKPGEIARVEMAAALLKETAKYQYQGGYSGVSFRIAKGVSYRTGGFRGNRVNVGTEIRVDDTGTIICTSQRCVFLGSLKTVEIPYNKLLSMDIYEDGIRFHISNKQKAIFIKLLIAHPIAALINASI